LRYRVTHPEKWTTGICGIRPNFWGHLLDDVEVNSLQAGAIVISHLLDRYNGDEFLALSHYKGAVYNYETVLRVLEIKDRL